MEVWRDDCDVVFVVVVNRRCLDVLEIEWMGQSRPGHGD